MKYLILVLRYGQSALCGSTIGPGQIQILPHCQAHREESDSEYIYISIKPLWEIILYTQEGKLVDFFDEVKDAVKKNHIAMSF